MLGMDVIVSPLAVKEDGRLFPFSKNRSRRIHKKLLKRFGGELRYSPAAYKADGKLVVHPVIYQELQRRSS